MGLLDPCDIHTGKPADEAPLPTICERVRHYRTLRKMEQKELARQLNITPNSVSNWECGRSRPDVSLLPEHRAENAETVGAGVEARDSEASGIAHGGDQLSWSVYLLTDEIGQTSVTL